MSVFFTELLLSFVAGNHNRDFCNHCHPCKSPLQLYNSNMQVLHKHHQGGSIGKYLNPLCRGIKHKINKYD